MGKGPKEAKSFMTNFLLVGVNCFARDKLKKLWCPFFVSSLLEFYYKFVILLCLYFLFLQLITKQNRNKTFFWIFAILKSFHTKEKITTLFYAFKIEDFNRKNKSFAYFSFQKNKR